jgi:hypothetical protein
MQALQFRSPAEDVSQHEAADIGGVVALIQEQPPRHSRLDLLDCLP